MEPSDDFTTLFGSSEMVVDVPAQFTQQMQDEGLIVWCMDHDEPRYEVIWDDEIATEESRLTRIDEILGR